MDCGPCRRDMRRRCVAPVAPHGVRPVCRARHRQAIAPHPPSRPIILDARVMQCFHAANVGVIPYLRARRNDCLWPATGVPAPNPGLHRIVIGHTRRSKRPAAPRRHFVFTRFVFCRLTLAQQDCWHERDDEHVCAERQRAIDHECNRPFGDGWTRNAATRKNAG